MYFLVHQKQMLDYFVTKYNHDTEIGKISQNLDFSDKKISNKNQEF